MFQITIQSPFETDPVVYNNCGDLRAIELYNIIDWTALWNTIESSGSSQESDYYYYEIKKNNFLGEAEEMCISGFIGPTICVGYFRPKTIIKKSFFKKKEVLESLFQTQMEDVSLAFGKFIAGNQSYLEQNMHDKEVL